MTVSQYQHHAEQMEAARKEFAAEWVKIKKQLIKAGFGGIARIHLETVFWQSWLHAKGLEK